MTDAELAARMARTDAERAALGREPTLQTASVYALLAAVIDNQASKSKGKE